MALVVSPGLVARVWIEELEKRAEHNLSLHEALSGGQLGKKGVQERDALSACVNVWCGVVWCKVWLARFGKFATMTGGDNRQCGKDSPC